MVSLSIVIPSYNRLPNLKLVLAALEAQKDAPPFEVIIADDGSTDGTREFCRTYKKNYSFPLICQWCGPNLGFHTSRTRNIGVAQARASHVVLLDSDVLLNPHALNYYEQAKQAFPEVIFVGLYHWAAKGTLTPPEVLESYDYVQNMVPNKMSAAPPVPGLDCRHEGFHNDLSPNNIITDYDGLGFFSGNIMWPVELWWKLQGQDEQMPSGMGEDAELGQRMRMGRCLIPLLESGIEMNQAIKECIPHRGPETALQVMQFAPTYGIHLPHERDVQKAQHLVQQSILYIDRKYLIGTYSEITDPETDPREKDRSMWYRKDDGAQLMRKDGDATVYAVSGMFKGYVGIPTPAFVELLGFTDEDIIVHPEDVDMFEDLEYHGIIRKD